MKLRLLAAAITLLFLLTACARSAQPAPPYRAVPPTPPAPMPKIGNPKAIPNTVGVTLEAAGPGLVVQGHTEQSVVQVELRMGSAVLKSAEVTPKDGGYWSVAWEQPKETGVEVVVSPKGQPDKVLVRGAVGTEMFAGLYYSKEFTAARVDMTNKEKGWITIAGNTSVPDKHFWVELRDSVKVFATHEVLTSGGVFNTTVEIPKGAHLVSFYTLEKDGSVQLALTIPVIIR